MTRELLSFTSMKQPRGALGRRKVGLEQKIQAASYTAGGEGRKSHFGLRQLKIRGSKAPPTTHHPFHTVHLASVPPMGSPLGSHIGHLSKDHPSKGPPFQGSPFPALAAIPLTRPFTTNL